MDFLPGVFVFMVPIVGAIALFTFLAVASWAEQRRREREAHYRYEFRKKLVEQGAANNTQLLDLLREEEAAEVRRMREGLKLAGIVTAAVGLGLIFGLRFIQEEEVWKVGYIPLFIGLGILVYALWLAPRAQAPASDNRPPTP